MEYEQVASISQVAALIFFIVLFAGVVVYALWPGNKKRFDEAAQLPLDDEPESENEKER